MMGSILFTTFYVTVCSWIERNMSVKVEYCMRFKVA